MTELNDRIRDALRADADDSLANLADEPNILEQVLYTFQSRNRFLVVFSIAMTFVIMAVGVFCAVKFFGAEEVKPMIAWSLGLALSFAAIGAMKIWYFMELQRNAIIREIKRLEIQVSRVLNAR